MSNLLSEQTAKALASEASLSSTKTSANSFSHPIHLWQCEVEATSNKCIDTSNKCLTSSNKKLLELRVIRIQLKLL